MSFVEWNGWPHQLTAAVHSLLVLVHLFLSLVKVEAVSDDLMNTGTVLKDISALLLIL